MQCSKNQNSVRKQDKSMSYKYFNHCSLIKIVQDHNKTLMVSIHLPVIGALVHFNNCVFVECSRYEQQRPGPPVPRGEGGDPALPEPAPRAAQESPAAAAGTRALNEPSRSFTVPGEGPY